MITIPISVSRESAAFVFLEEAYDRGIVDHHTDGKYRIFTFYDPEDEFAFILKFGRNFSEYIDIDSSGVFYYPYIPQGI